MTKVLFFIAVVSLSALIVLGCAWRSNVLRLRDERDVARKDAADLRAAATPGQAGDDRDVYDRNTELWMTDDHRNELDARFSQVVAPLLRGESP